MDFDRRRSYENDKEDKPGDNDDANSSNSLPQHASFMWTRGGGGLASLSSSKNYPRHVRYPSSSSVSSAGSLNVPPAPPSITTDDLDDFHHGHEHSHSFSNMETPLVGHTQKKKAYHHHYGSASSPDRGYNGDGGGNYSSYPGYRSAPLDRCISGDEDFDENDGSSCSNSNGSSRKGRKKNRSFDESDEDRALLLGEEYGDDENENDKDDNDDDDDRSVNTSYSTATASSIVTITTAATNFRDNLMLPFTDETGSTSSVLRGLTALVVVGAAMGLVLKPRTIITGSGNAIHGSNNILWRSCSSIIGYCYFVLWSVCFYPQVLLNYRRRSTKGLSPDFAVLNLLGWSYYSLYLSEMYWDTTIKVLYQARFEDEASTVASNDVAFAIHAALLSALYLIQIAWYSDDDGISAVLHLKPQTWCLVLLMVIPTVVTPLLIWGGILDRSAWLDYFYVLSFFKILCTLTKYAKQAVLNYHRKSTKGWNIWYNYLECTGGALSMLQIVLDSASRGNWNGIAGNLAKFALGLSTIFFDGVFFLQHYILYPEPKSAGHDDGMDDHAKLGKVPRPSDRFDIVYLTSPDDGGEAGGSGGLDDLDDNDEENAY